MAGGKGKRAAIHLAMAPGPAAQQPASALPTHQRIRQPAALAPAKAHLARRLANLGVTEDLTTDIFRALALVLTGYAVTPSAIGGDDTLTLTWGLFHPHELLTRSLPNMDLGTARLAEIVGRAQAALAALSPNLTRAVSNHLEPQLKDLARALLRLGTTGPAHDSVLWARLANLEGFINTTPTHLAAGP